MKKFEITVTTKQGEKKVCVYVDSETAAILKSCSEEVRIAYLEELYKEQLLERKETVGTFHWKKSRRTDTILNRRTSPLRKRLSRQKKANT